MYASEWAECDYIDILQKDENIAFDIAEWLLLH